jgi:hypothetical protein
MTGAAPVISLQRAKIRRARNVVRVHKLYRLEGELALALLLRLIDLLQTDLDRAVEELRATPRRKAA